VVKDAILRATRPGEIGAFAQVCAVFDASRRVVPLAVTVARTGPLALAAACPDPVPLALRKGRWLFGGIGFLHFGHALIFSTARLWALDLLQDPPDGILFFDRSTTGETRSGCGRNLQAILALLGISLPVVTVSRDERVEELLIPEQGVSTSAALFAATEPYRRFVRHRLAPPPGRPAMDNIYISRAKLGPARPGLMFEDRIEALMAASGYRIFHPQRASLADQVALYHGAGRLVAVDGSALHLAAFALPGTARVSILARRPYFPEALAGQIQAVSGATAQVLRPASRIYRSADPAQSGDTFSASYCLSDFPALSQLLLEAGALPAGTTPWPDPTDQDLAARLALIGRSTGRPLDRYHPDR
jgi:Glycosyltransferase 61